MSTETYMASSFVGFFMPIAMSFINTLHVQPIPGTDRRILLRALVYVTSPGVCIVVAKGFVTDYASVPGFLSGVFSHDAGDTRRPSVLHDWLYINHNGFTRKQVDGLFLVTLQEEGVGWLRRWAMWSAVRLFGGQFWG